MKLKNKKKNTTHVSIQSLRFALAACLVFAALQANAARYYVDSSSTTNTGGTSWATAFNKLETAVTTASNNDTIWVAKGTYNAPTARYALKNGVAIYGGFLNTHTLLGQRNWQANATILKGDGTRSVFYNVSVNNSAVLNGFTITGGGGTSGGGMLNISASPTLTNLIFSRNICAAASGQVSGGGMYNSSFSSPVLTNVVFSENRSETGNVSGAFAYGGGIYNYQSSPILNNVIFYKNAAFSTSTGYNTYGGAVANFYVSSTYGTANLAATNVVFIENSAKIGGGVYEYASTSFFTHCNWANNAGFSAGQESQSGNTTLTNCIYFNTGATFSFSGTTVTSRNCYAPSTIPGTASGNVISSVNPFDNYTFPQGGDELWFTADDGLRLKTGFSAALIDAGLDVASSSLSTAIKSAAATDMTGLARPVGTAYDIGAYEGSVSRPTRFYVDSASTAGSPDGLSWATAFTRLEDALNTAVSSDSIWVAKGTYQPAVGQSFTMKQGVRIFGGFVNSDTAFVQRNYGMNSTLLSGNGNSVIRNEYTSTRPLSNQTMLDGFIITGGNAVDGGGMYNKYASPFLRNIVFTNNTAQQGGGMYNDVSSAGNFINVVFHNNTGTVNGGGMSNNSAQVVLAHVTFNSNSSPLGGGLYGNFSTDSITNCIFWNNGTDVQNTTGVLKISNSFSAQTLPGSNNLLGTSSPFVAATNAMGVDGHWMTADDGLQLKHSPSISPINTGKKRTGTDVTFLPSDNYDILRTIRDNGKAYDMGAYEFIPPYSTRVFVDSSQTVNVNDGLTWATAYSKLEDAINDPALKIGDSLWVARGTYSPTSGSFYTMKNSLSILGGFLNTHSSATQRDWTNNKTILKGNGNSVIRNTSAGINNSAVLDGFTITGGKASSGGGMFNNLSSPLLNNLIFANDTATASGGGMYNSSSAATLNNVTFIGNVALFSGGGMENSSSSITLDHVVFTQNIVTSASSNGGGGMYCWNVNSFATLRNVVFDRNVSASAGGGLSASSELVTFDMTNVIFYGNAANIGGGMNNFGVGRAKNLTFCKNSSVQFAGGLRWSATNNFTYIPATVSNCVFWGNTNSANALTADKTTGNGVKFSHCYVQNLKADDTASTVLGTISPFINEDLPRGVDGLWFTEDDGLQLKFCSTALNAGDNVGNAAVSTDITGRPRIKNSSVDMGAYEKQSNTTAGQFNTNASLSSIPSNNSIFPATCDDNGWTYYADPSQPDSLSFAINWGSGNSAAKAAARIYLTVDSALTGAYNTTSGVWAMKRYWNVDLNNTTLINPVQLRFYYDPADTLALRDSALAANLGGPIGDIQWFKTNGSPYQPSQVSPTNINGGSRTLLAPVYGSDNNVAYVQFNSIQSFSGGTAAITAGAAVPLPVKLLDFSAKRSNDDLTVTTMWKAANESIDLYKIERSMDGKSFVSVGSIKAVRHTDYSFRDNLDHSLQNQTLYYRLNLIESNGGNSYSKTIKVLPGASSNLVSIAVSPNPASETITVSINGTIGQQAAISIFSSTGQLVRTIAITSSVQAISLNSLPAGIYLIKYTDDQATNITRFQKL